MFFVFECGNPQEGEAAGGLGDMRGAFNTVDAAKAFAVDTFPYLDDVEILNGDTGEVISAPYPYREWEITDAVASGSN